MSRYFYFDVQKFEERIAQVRTLGGRKRPRSELLGKAYKQLHRYFSTRDIRRGRKRISCLFRPMNSAAVKAGVPSTSSRRSPVS